LDVNWRLAEGGSALNRIRHYPLRAGCPRWVLVFIQDTHYVLLIYDLLKSSDIDTAVRKDLKFGLGCFNMTNLVAIQESIEKPATGGARTPFEISSMNLTPETMAFIRDPVVSFV